MSSYKYSQSRYSSGRKREIPVTDEMRKLVPTSRICINAERDTIYIYNGKEKPAKAQCNLDNIPATINGIKQKVIDLFEPEFRRRNCDPNETVTEWCGVLSDQLLELEGKSDLDDEDEQEKRPCYIHKYKDIESVIVGDQPYLIQMKEGELDFNLYQN